MPSEQNKASPALPFVRGGLAGVIGWLAIHPADVLKVRLQVNPAVGGTAKYSGPWHAFRSVAANEGIAGLYSGLSAALTRQVVYTTLRLGLYTTLRDRVTEEGTNPTLYQKLAIGLASGGTASAISNPIEVSMVRMYNDGCLPPEQRRGYRHIGDALWRISRNEGVAGLWAGATPTVARAMIVSAVQLGVYDQAKETYQRRLGMKDGVPLHLSASLTSGYAYSVVTLPIDLAKSRMQNEKVKPGMQREYKSIVQTIAKIARNEGVLSLWKGFTPYFVRCGGHTVAMFLALEQVKKYI